MAQGHCDPGRRPNREERQEGLDSISDWCHPPRLARHCPSEERDWQQNPPYFEDARYAVSCAFCIFSNDRLQNVHVFRFGPGNSRGPLLLDQEGGFCPQAFGA